MQIAPSQVIFLIISGLTIVSALMVVTTRNLFHAALWLVGSFFGVAAIYAMLESEFLAVAQIMIYIGAISTLIVFATMLTRGMMLGRMKMANFQSGISAVVAVLLFVLLAFLLVQINWPLIEGAVSNEMIGDIGSAFVGTYLVPFEVVSVLLLIALLGAIMIARER